MRQEVKDTAQVLAMGLRSYFEDNPYAYSQGLEDLVADPEPEQVVGVLLSVLEVIHPKAMEEMTTEGLTEFLLDCGFTDMAFVENYVHACGK